MADEIHDSISTKELRLVDDAGKPRALFNTKPDGSVVVSFMDNNNQTRIKVGVNEDGAALFEMSSGTEVPSMKLTVDKDGNVYLQGSDNHGVERFKLELRGNGSHTELSFHEKNKKPRMTLMAEDKGPAGLFILDHNGKALFSTNP